MRPCLATAVVFLAITFSAVCADQPVSIAQQPDNSWVKRSPLPDGPPSPRLGYESSWGYDPRFGKLIRWGGHDPGGGGPQLSETWAFDLKAGAWEFMTPNNNPPGNCCCRENAVDPSSGLFYRFSHPAFGHGWMWDRSRYLREDSVWTYDLAANRWTNMRPGKEPHLNVGKPAFYDPNNQIIWVYDTKLRAYDQYTNTWHIVSENAKVTGGQNEKPIGKRTYAAMTLHPRRNKIVLFGDHYQSDPRTLVYDIATDEWTDVKTVNSPPWDRSCPTMVYDSANNVMICVVLGDKWDTKDESKRRLETWTYELESSTWTRMDVQGGPDHFGTRDRLMAYVPEMNIVVLESRGNEQQIWTYRYKVPPPPAPRLPGPTDLKVETLDGGKARLVCKGPVFSGRQVDFQAFRAEATDKPWQAVFKKVGDFSVVPRGEGIQLTLTDTGLEQGKVYHYLANALPVSPPGPESPATRKVRTQPRLIVESRVDVLSADKVVYSWKKSDEPDVAGYVVERAVVLPVSAAQKVSTVKQYGDGQLPLEAMAEKAIIGNFKRLTDKPISAAEFTDAVDLTKKVAPDGTYWQALFSPRVKGAPATRPEDDKGFDMTRPGCPYAIYAYRVRAVNRLGVAGGPSPYQLTIPNEVEGIFTKEDGKDVQIRWQPSPHRSIRGYLVYRLDGRYGPVSLLTPAPVGETTFTDKTAAGQARRYYIVVVDALGQQGIPTHEAWGFREYGQIYSKFLAKDGWHQ